MWHVPTVIVMNEYKIGLIGFCFEKPSSEKAMVRMPKVKHKVIKDV